MNTHYIELTIALYAFLIMANIWFALGNPVGLVWGVFAVITCILRSKHLNRIEEGDNANN